MHRCLSWMQASPLPPSFHYTNCLCRLWDVRPNASSWVFLVFLSFCWSSFLVHFTNDPEYLTRGTAPVFMRFLLCSLASSSFLVLLIYSFFFFHLCMFDGIRFLAFWFFLDVVVLFLLSFIVFRFSLAWHVFLCQIPWLYILSVLGFPNLFHFWQTIWCRPFTWGGWFFPAIYEACSRLCIS